MANYLTNPEIIVENPCITLCKTPCILLVKFCANLHASTTTRVKLPQFHFFITHFTPSYPQPPTPIVQLFYPLFHQAYYYNYK